MPEKGIGREMRKVRLMRAKYHASFGILETDIASEVIIAGTVTMERKEEREKEVQLFFYRARKRRPRKNW
jgi:hypothetical protein